MRKSALPGKLFAFLVVFTFIVVSFQNCSSVRFSPGFEGELGSQGNDCVANPQLCAPVAPSCSFNGQALAEGQSTTAYLYSSVPAGQTCVSEVRTCKDGALSGSYSFASCGVGTPSACLFNGQTIAHGQSVDGYQNSSVAYGATCTKEPRLCNNGILSGSYNYAACTVGSAASCLFNGQTIADGGVVKSFQSSTVAFGQSCVSEDRICRNGVLSGSYGFANCAPGVAAGCLFNGQGVAHGASVVGYASSSVAYGQTCAAQTRTCTNGVLNGSYSFPSCSPGAAVSCSFNGQTIAHGQSVVGYAAPSVGYGNSCSAQSRTCNNGVLSGSYAYGSCTTNAASSCYFNGQTIGHGGSVYAYSSSSVSYGSSCVGQTRTCDNGTLSGYYGASSCSVQSPSCPSSFYPGILCQVNAVCPNGRLVATNVPDHVMALTVSGYTGLNAQPGSLQHIYNYNVDFRLPDMSLVYINHRIRCSANGSWADDSGYPGGSGCIAQKNLPSWDSRCQ